MVCISTLFFIVVPGRMVPAMAIVTSAAQPRLRGTFLSIVGATQQFSVGVASYVGGLIIYQDAGGRIMRYDIVGYLAVAVALLAIALAGRIRVQS